MDHDESAFDLDSIIYQSALAGIQDTLVRPFRKMASSARSIRARCRDLSREVEASMLRNTVYDLEHPYGKE